MQHPSISRGGSKVAWALAFKLRIFSIDGVRYVAYIGCIDSQSTLEDGIVTQIEDTRADIASRLVRMRNQRDRIREALQRYDDDHVELLASVTRLLADTEKGAA